jgi:SulP family sulfate permease
VTVVVVVATHNLAYGVGAGVLTAMVLFARRVAHLVDVTRTPRSDGGEVVYTVDGQVFFASSNDLVYQFHYADDPDRVVIDLTRAHVWDASSVAALDAITFKYARRGKVVTIVGLDEHSASMHDRLAGRLSGH